MTGAFLLNRQQIEWAWVMRIKGHNVDQIANALHVSYKTITRAFKRQYGITQPTRYAELTYDYDEVRKYMRRFV